MIKGYVLVYTTASAFESEDILGSLDGVSVRLVPTPREFSSDCGIAVYFETNILEFLQEALASANIECEIKLLD
ncbi:MAG: DUF3343 domain-containing protein [Helicobacteraceae bacterium]|nr:DUF3343 domain-containing protein [Helicobacteraceae bacterium]